MPIPTAKYRNELPQLAGRPFLTDGGLETSLIFHEGWQLPHFAACVLVESERGQAALTAYFERYAALAVKAGAGFIIESATWRAGPDWGSKLGYDTAKLETLNRSNIEILTGLRNRFETASSPMVISACIGPRGDGYDPGQLMNADEAERYHAWQIAIFRTTSADLVSAMTMTNVNEALGVARAARAAAMPCVISFTVETDGRLPTGETLKDAIAAVDAGSGDYPAYYMINCAHPKHFGPAIEFGETWIERIRGIRANASERSHQELNNSSDLDDGDPHTLGQQYRALLERMTHLNVFGGCCGTDHRHVACIAAACVASGAETRHDLLTASLSSPLGA
jgi:homocysteine S-methyltransferase